MDATGPNKSSQIPSPKAAAGLYWFGLMLIAAAVLAGLAEPLATLMRHVPKDDNEGWNAFFGNIALTGGDLYPIGKGFVTDNYPPLSFYIVGTAGRWLGDNIIAGRIVALAALLVVTLNIYAWLRITGAAYKVAVLGAAAFLGLAVTYAPDYVAMNDPQWLAHALMTTGLVVLWRAASHGASSDAASRTSIGASIDRDAATCPKPVRTGGIVAASLLMLAAGCTKHLLIPLPIAATLWLMRRSKAATRTWMICAVMGLAAAGLLVWWLYGRSFFESMVSSRTYHSAKAAIAAATAVKCFEPVLLLSIIGVLRAPGNERVFFVAAYLIVSAVVGTLASGGAGVDVNAFFDLLIAASLGASLGIERLWSWRAPRALKGIAVGPAVVLLLGISLAAYAATKLPAEIDAIGHLDATERATMADIRLIAERGHGRAACESLALCYWAGSHFTLDYFNYGQKLRRGKLPFSSCEEALGPRNVALLQIGPGKVLRSRQLPEPCNEIIRRNFARIPQAQSTVLLTPLETGSQQAQARPRDTSPAQELQ